MFVAFSEAQPSNRATKKTDIHQYLTIRLHGGLVIPHHPSMMYFIEDYSKGFEINYGRTVFSEDSWQSTFNYPEIGLGLYYGTFGNKNIYGAGLAFFPYINYNIYRSNRITLQNRVSMGLGYVNHPFDIDDNPYNSIFSSHLNIYIRLGLLFDYRINKNFSLSASGALTHLSNGATKKPNHGINTITTSIGTKYHFNSKNTPSVRKTKPELSHKREVLIGGNFGRSQSNRYNNQKYWNTSINIQHLWYLNKKRALGLGFDQFYTESIPFAWMEFANGELPEDLNSSYYWINGLYASYNVFLGKTTLYVNIGKYLHTKMKPPETIYPRIGIRHYLGNHLIANFSVKASFFRAEFLEFGLGYRFKYKQ